MANNYYVFTPDFIPGQKVASGEMNSQLSGIESGFDALPGAADAIVKGVAYRGTEAGSGNSYTITMDDTRTAYADGDRVLFKATHTNTGASSINLDSIGLIPLVLADSSATGASEILSGRFYEAVYVAASNHFQLTTPGAAATATAALQVGYAEEWASKAEDSLVSTAAGGNGTTEYSALHWAAKAAADVVLTNADVVTTNADVVLTNADVVSTNADVVTTNADAATTTQDAIDTAADAVSTAADAVSTAADVITAAASQAAAGISETNAGASEAAAAASETAAGLSETNAAATYDVFDDRFLGSKATEPTLDNDGDALLTGAMFWDSTNNLSKVYDGAAWQVVPGLQNVVEDTTPQLGGALDVNGKDITSASNGDVNLAPNGTGVVQKDGVQAFPSSAYSWDWGLVAEGEHTMTGHLTSGGENYVLHEEVAFTGGTEPDATDDIRLASYMVEAWLVGVSGAPTAIYDDNTGGYLWECRWEWDPDGPDYNLNYTEGSANGLLMYGPGYNVQTRVMFKVAGTYNEKLQLQMEAGVNGTACDSDTVVKLRYRIFRKGQVLVA